MSTIEKIEDKLAGAKQQGQAQFESIRGMVEALEANQRRDTQEQEKAWEEAERAIHEDALSVEVRSGWYVAGGAGDEKPAEYRILLCTGGPAVQITGELSEHGEPETAQMQVQDWFQPWTDFDPAVAGFPDRAGQIMKGEEIMLAYARCFWFGE